MRTTIGETGIKRIACPKCLQSSLGSFAPECFYLQGASDALNSPSLGLLCSIQCPGNIVLRTFDTIRALRDAGITLVGGFHSPMERECLDFLLRGAQPVIFCPARGLRNLRIGAEARQAIKDGRLLLLSPFGDHVRRSTAAQAAERNQVVAALATALYVPYADPGGKSWQSVQSALDRKRSVYTFDVEDNADLIAAGAEAVPEIPALLSSLKN